MARGMMYGTVHVVCGLRDDLYGAGWRAGWFDVLGCICDVAGHGASTDLHNSGRDGPRRGARYYRLYWWNNVGDEYRNLC